MDTTEAPATVASRPSALNPADLDTIKGWFGNSDQLLFAFLLERQLQQETPGDLVELGCYLGKSAVLIGQFRRDDDRFTVLDLFEGAEGDDANRVERERSYATLTRNQFEANYARFHPNPPIVVQELSSEILRHVPAGSCRFVHIDASHLYEHVAADADAARIMLRPDGIVAFDDYRSEHTPGVAAAAWEAVLNKDLRLIAVTESKLYGTWGDPAPVIDAIESWLAERGSAYVDRMTIAGQSMVRLRIAQLPAAEPVRPVAAKPAQPAPAKPQPAADLPGAGRPTGRRGVRRLAHEWLPPKVHRTISHRLNPPGN